MSLAMNASFCTLKILKVYVLGLLNVAIALITKSRIMFINAITIPITAGRVLDSNYIVYPS
jgi:hypothetical protein